MRHLVMIGALALSVVACKPELPTGQAMADPKGPPRCACDQAKTALATQARPGVKVVKAAPLAARSIYSPGPARRRVYAGPSPRRAYAERRVYRSRRYASQGSPAYDVSGEDYAQVSHAPYVTPGVSESVQVQSRSYGSQSYSESHYESGSDDSVEVAEGYGYGGQYGGGYARASLSPVRAYTVSQNARGDVRRSRAEMHVRCPQ
jgi:hypothetical protein